MKPYDVADHEYSLLPEGKKWKLVWNDEFDGKELDETKWSFRRHIMGCKHETDTDAEGIELDGNSNLIFRVIEKDGKFLCRLDMVYGWEELTVTDTGAKGEYTITAVDCAGNMSQKVTF